MPNDWRGKEYTPGSPNRTDPTNIYHPKEQPVVGGGHKPQYYVPPEQLYPIVRNPSRNPDEFYKAEVQAGQELIPTSVNIRNLALQRLLQQYQTPMEQMYLAQLSNPVAAGRAGQMDQWRNAMAQRGLTNSGVNAEGQRGIEMGYVEGQANAAMQAQQMEQNRRMALLGQIQGIPAQDMAFYQAIREGTVPASQPQDQHAQDWYQAMHGAGTAVRSIAMAAAGGGGGGSFGSAGGSGTFGSGLSSTGAMTSAGMGYQNVYGQTFSGMGTYQPQLGGGANYMGGGGGYGGYGGYGLGMGGMY